MLMDPTAISGTPQDAPLASLLRELEAREAEIAENLKGLDSSAKKAAIGEELLVIQEKKLYRAAGFKSLKAYLDAGRNKMSRARANQLIDHAKYRRHCLATGAPLPANERQTRRILKDRKLDLSGNLDPGEAVLVRLDKELVSWPQQVKAIFAHYLVNMAAEFIEGRENGYWAGSLAMLERLRRTHKTMPPDDKASFANELLEAAEFLAAGEPQLGKSAHEFCGQNPQKEPTHGNNSSPEQGTDPGNAGKT